MRQFEPNRVMNGSFGEAWLDGDYLAEVTEGKAEVSISYGDVSRIGQLTSGKKMMKLEGKGSLKLNHVRSNIAKKASDMVKRGKTPAFMVILKLDDPDAFGVERVALYGCKLDKITLMDWTSNKLTEESIGFTFEDWEQLDFVEVS